MALFPNAKAEIHKKGFSASRPWQIDIRWADGQIWQGWAWGFKTKKAAIAHCEAVGVKVAA